MVSLATLQVEITGDTAALGRPSAVGTGVGCGAEYWIMREDGLLMAELRDFWAAIAKDPEAYRKAFGEMGSRPGWSRQIDLDIEKAKSEYGPRAAARDIIEPEGL